MAKTGTHGTGGDPLLYGVDWNEVWKERMRLHQSSEHFADSCHVWKKEENAKRYDTISRRDYGRRVSQTLAGLEITPDSRVLDIGSGPGTLAIPLSGRVTGVTAAEPAPGMVKVLASNIRNEGIDNIKIVQKAWEDIDTKSDLADTYDIIIASLSLGMPDLRDAVRKMEEVCSGTVNLYWFVDMPFWEKLYSLTWPELHGSSYHPGPKVDCLFMVLYQMGIYPNVEMMTLDKEYRFSGPDEMYNHFRSRFGVTEDRGEKIMRRYLSTLVKKEDGDLVLSGNSVYAKVWWRCMH
ncbi:MAG TPA: class I SAM-dependent methyltransferase [Methanoregulaceae archaeon]|nr:class I SAM-dependent methyltransferase [Methanoregulaceae archaeon]